MNRHERGLEFKVGVFVFVGLAMLGALVVQFGRLGEGLKTYYALTVGFTDASGLLKGSDVLLAGARIGKVSGGPRMVREGQGVDVPLKIYEYIKIPEGSKFTVGSSGLLGDRFVNVMMPPGKPKAFLAPNTYINGTRETGIDDLTREGGALVTGRIIQEIGWSYPAGGFDDGFCKTSSRHLTECDRRHAQSAAQRHTR